jgi:hypothetical protein
VHFLKTCKCTLCLSFHYICMHSITQLWMNRLW